VAPATRIAVGEEFGLPSGTVSTGKLIHALRAVGFDYVFDTNFAADLTIMEEGSELLSRVREGGVLPLMTSCCPGWVNWVELNRPDLIPHLSTTRSPQQMHGALTKRGPFAQTLGIDVHGQVIEPFTVSVMPCTAKKDEAHRPGLRGDVDRVLTTRELARLLKARGVALASMPDDGVFDDPLGASTGAAQIFAASGGVMEAVVRAAAHLMGAQEALALEWQALRGVDQGLKTTLIPGVGLVAVCNGIAAAQHLFSTPDWQQMYVAIEVMACHGGCLGGGGEPKSDDPAILQKRMQAVYEIDATAVHRRSYENPSVQSLYAQGLSHPNSPQAHTLLHTGYAARHSLRSVLMRFLDAVDRRDTGTIAQLFHPQALWQTASPLGDIQGLDHIVALVRDRLPSLSAPGGSVQRHRMKNPSSADDLSVVTPNGEECRFTLEIEGALDQPSSVKIKRLTRWLT
jgi:NADH-quinone oxidoreductase subunit G